MCLRRAFAAPSRAARKASCRGGRAPGPCNPPGLHGRQGRGGREGLASLCHRLLAGRTSESCLLADRFPWSSRPPRSDSPQRSARSGGEPSRRYRSTAAARRRRNRPSEAADQANAAHGWMRTSPSHNVGPASSVDAAASPAGMPAGHCPLQSAGRVSAFAAPGWAALPTASAVMLTMRRTVAEGVRM